MLTDVKVAKLKFEGDREPGKLRLDRHADRDGLYLAVSPPHKSNPKAGYGSKVWRYDYRWPQSAQGKRQTLTYGKYPKLTLSEARDKHLAAQKLMEQGINPADDKQKKKQAQLSALGNTYESISAKWYEAEKQGKSKSWCDNNDRWLKLVNKKLGPRAIGSISHDDCYNAIRPLEDDGYAFSADRARQQVAQVFAYAIRKRLHSGTNPAQELKGEIKVPEHKNHRHFRATEIPGFLKAIDGSKAEGKTKLAARLLLLTMTRKHELLALKWPELDLDNGLWEIPAERMKNRIPHLVPISRQAAECFVKLRETFKGDYVFPSSQRGRAHMGLSTLNVFFDRIGVGDKLTPHGLRSVASTELNGCGAFRPDVIERALSHVQRNKTRSAYNKADYLDERRRMMQHWADFIDRLCEGKGDGSNVVQLQTKAAA